jgi:hypothetical protein
MTDSDDHRDKVPALHHTRNASTRIDVFEELTPTSEAALRQFFRRVRAPHYVDEVIIPTLKLGDSQVFCTVRDRPWPPWGLGGRTISAVCQTQTVAAESWSISPVFVGDEDASNIGLICALYREVLMSLAESKNSEVNYLAIEGSVLADHALRAAGFRRDEDIVLTEQARYFTYRTPAAELMKMLGLDKVQTPDLLAHDFPEEVLARNAYFHHSIQLGSRAELFSDHLIAEIIGLARGGHASKPGGVPGGTGTDLGTDQFGPSFDDFIYVALGNFLGDARVQLLDAVLERVDEFKAATVHPENADAPVVDEQIRRAKVLEDVSFIEKSFIERLKGALAPALSRLGMDGFPVGQIELQITASGDGDYYRMHRDADASSSRELSFVYFFHREPRGFSGGELRLFDDRRVRGKAHADASQLLSPRQDALVIFPSRSPHELLPVRVPSKEFADSRFTLNGWIHRAKNATAA